MIDVRRVTTTRTGCYSDEYVRIGLRIEQWTDYGYMFDPLYRRTMKFIQIMKLQVAGIGRHDWKDDLGNLLGGNVQYEEEPENKFDPGAIAIYRDKRKLGYVPRPWNHVVKNLLKTKQFMKFIIDVSEVPHAVMLGIYMEERT